MSIGLTRDGAVGVMVGLHKAKELFLMAATIDAVEAYRLGLGREVHQPEELLPAATELAHRLAAGPTLAFGLGKALVRLAVSADLESYLALEAVGQSTVMKEPSGRRGGVPSNADPPCSQAGDPGPGSWSKPSR